MGQMTALDVQNLLGALAGRRLTGSGLRLHQVATGVHYLQGVELQFDGGDVLVVGVGPAEGSIVLSGTVNAGPVRFTFSGVEE